MNKVTQEKEENRKRLENTEETEKIVKEILSKKALGLNYF